MPLPCRKSLIPPPKSFTSALQNLTSRVPTSLWGKIYYGQGRYLYSEALEGNFTPTDAYRILKYSSELDKTAAEIDRELLKKKGEIVQRMVVAPMSQPKAPTELDSYLAVVLAACVAAFGLSAVYRMAKEKQLIRAG